MIEYKKLTSDSLEDIKALYRQHGWMAYLNDDEKLTRAFDASIYTLGAYENDKLVGFIRCVGDGEHIVMVQDLIVAEEYQRKGIGRNLMNLTGERYCDVRMFMLMTDALDENANAFYQAIGMKKLDQIGCVSYVR